MSPRHLSPLFDVVVSGSTEAIGRADLLRRLSEVRTLDYFETDRFIGGLPLRILQRADETAANALAEKLRRIGAIVSVEPSPPEFSMPSNISLISLDGDEGPAVAPPPLDLPAPTPQPAPPPKPAPLPPVARPDHDAFSAPPILQDIMELERPRAPPKPTGVAPPSDDVLPPHLTLHQEEEAPPAPIPGRLLQGQLRLKPAVRLLIGLALGLLIGYALSSPYQTRAEHRVAQVRAQANADRYRPVDEARANAARLDQEDDDMASSAFIVTLVIWLGTAGAIVAGWYRLT